MSQLELFCSSQQLATPTQLEGTEPHPQQSENVLCVAPVLRLLALLAISAVTHFLLFAIADVTPALPFNAKEPGNKPTNSAVYSPEIVDQSGSCQINPYR